MSDHLKNIIKQSLMEKSSGGVNPWAVCHASTGPKKTKKFERCVKKVKKTEGISEDAVRNARIDLAERVMETVTPSAFKGRPRYMHQGWPKFNPTGPARAMGSAVRGAATRAGSAVRGAATRAGSAAKGVASDIAAGAEPALRHARVMGKRTARKAGEVLSRPTEGPKTGRGSGLGVGRAIADGALAQLKADDEVKNPEVVKGEEDAEAKEYQAQKAASDKEQERVKPQLGLGGTGNDTSPATTPLPTSTPAKMPADIHGGFPNVAARRQATSTPAVRGRQPAQLGGRARRRADLNMRTGRGQAYGGIHTSTEIIRNSRVALAEGVVKKILLGPQATKTGAKPLPKYKSSVEEPKSTPAPTARSSQPIGGALGRQARYDLDKPGGYDSPKDDKPKGPKPSPRKGGKARDKARKNQSGSPESERDAIKKLLIAASTEIVKNSRIALAEKVLSELNRSEKHNLEQGTMDMDDIAKGRDKRHVIGKRHSPRRGVRKVKQANKKREQIKNSVLNYLSEEHGKATVTTVRGTSSGPKGHSRKSAMGHSQAGMYTKKGKPAKNPKSQEADVDATQRTGQMSIQDINKSGVGGKRGAVLRMALKSHRMNSPLPPSKKKKKNG